MSEAESQTRSLILLNEMGDIEIEWEEQNDAVMRDIIQRKMDSGMKFFHYVTVGKKTSRKPLKTLKDLKEARIEIADEDIENAFRDGKIDLNRRAGGEDFPETKLIKDAALAAQTQTVGVRQFQAG